MSRVCEKFTRLPDLLNPYSSVMSSIEFINLFTETKRDIVKNYIISGNIFCIEKFIKTERDEIKEAFAGLKQLINPECFKQYLNEQQKQDVVELEKSKKWNEVRNYIVRSGSPSAIKAYIQWEANCFINPLSSSNLPVASVPTVVADHPTSLINSQSKSPKKSDREWSFQIPSNLAGLIIGKNGQYLEEYKENCITVSMEQGVLETITNVKVDGWDAPFEKVHQVCMDFLLRIAPQYPYSKLIPFHPMLPFEQLLFMEDNGVIINVLDDQSYQMYSFDASCHNNALSTWNSDQRFRQTGPLTAFSHSVSEESIPEIIPKPAPRTTTSQRSKKIYNEKKFLKPVIAFPQPETDFLEFNLKQETGILLLGQSGVGKSTFLNAFANYLEFGRNFEKAEKNLRVLVKAQCELSYYDNRNPVTVVMTPPGDEDGENERLGDGQSSTQEARCYTINYKTKTETKTIKIIDTPGLLDIGGIEKDQLKIARILKCLQNFKTIQAIVFFFKPDEAINKAPLIYNLNELLSRLHKKAADNILFCFPRSDLQQHNDTVITLRKIFENVSNNCGVRIEMKQSQNIFRVDNQGFLYLGGAKYGNFDLQGEERRSAKENWICSATAVEKMLNKIATLPDYEVQKTLHIADTKNWLKVLSKPMADFSLQILGHQGILGHLEDELKLLALESKSLEEKHIYQQTNYVRIPTEQRMICFSESCAIPAGTEHIPYECHKDCNCIEMTAEETGKHLLNCSVFVNKVQGICNACKCPWDTHRLINYRIEKKTVQINNSATEANMNEHQRIVAKIKEIKEKIEENEHSLELLRKNGALFAIFIAQHSLVFENDSFSSYLHQYLQTANDEEQCKNLERFKKEYEQEKSFYLTDSCEKVSHEDVLKKLEELKTDKNIGDLLTKLNEELGMGNEETVSEEKVIVTNAIFAKPAGSSDTSLTKYENNHLDKVKHDILKNQMAFLDKKQEQTVNKDLKKEFGKFGNPATYDPEQRGTNSEREQNDRMEPRTSNEEKVIVTNALFTKSRGTQDAEHWNLDGTGLVHHWLANKFLFLCCLFPFCFLLLKYFVEYVMHLISI